MPRLGFSANYGGARPGAGRKPGTNPLATVARQKAVELLSNGRTPLDVMIGNMRFYDVDAHKLYEQLLVEFHSRPKGMNEADWLKMRLNIIDRMEKLKDKAGLAARDAAPYMHPHVVSMELGNKGDKPFQVFVIGPQDANH